MTDTHLPLPNNEWYAVYAVVRHEKKVDTAISKEKIKTFLPLREQISQWNDRKKKIQVPLFPGYLFVNISPQDKWAVLKVLNTRGVVRILSFNGVHVPIPDNQIDSIRTLLRSNQNYELYPYYTEGKEVEIINGPLQGIRGKVLERKGNHKLVLSVDMIQRSIAVQIDLKDTEPV